MFESTDTIEPGIHLNFPEKAYHADPAPLPSLSSSVAKVLVDKTPAHAWQMHPRLNPDHVPVDLAKFDVGKAAHRLVCGGDAAIAEIAAVDYRGAAAKRARDDALEAGLLPVTRPQMGTVRAMAEALRGQADQIAQASGIREPFKHGDGEVTVVAELLPKVYARVRCDWLAPASVRWPFFIFDYKTTDVSADPDRWQRLAYGIGFDIQEALYRRVVAKVLDIDPAEIDFVFVVQETDPPYLVSMVRLDKAAKEIADQKVEFALQRWTHCLAADAWPGHPARVVDIEAPVWNAAAFEASVIRQNDAGGSAAMLQTLTGWQAPLKETDK